MPFSWTYEKANRTWKRRFGNELYKLLLDFNECDRTAKLEDFYVIFIVICDYRMVFC